MRWVAFATILALLPSLAHAQASPQPACGTPAIIDDTWPIDTPESAGLHGARLCEIEPRLKALDANVHAVVIVRHGKLVFEQYYSGNDSPWGAPNRSYDFDAVTKHDMRSISKSVTSLLVGIVIDRKLIADVDEPVAKFFPEISNKAPEWSNVTLRHLLTMSSGLKWEENVPYNDERNNERHLDTEADPVGYTFAQPFAMPPGSVWAYNGGGTNLLGAIIERVSGTSIEEFARENLFAPLGITDWEWKLYRNGKRAFAAGLRLRPRDAAKIGQLVLNRGEWNGRPIVSASWIAESVTPRFQAIGFFGGLFYYGYQWWLGRTLAGDGEIKWTAGIGLGGQRLYIIPQLDMVVMTTAGLYTSPRQGSGALDILYRIVIPAVIDKGRTR